MMRFVATALLSAIVLVILALAGLVYGPGLESRFWPVITITAKDEVITEDRLYFTLSGDKFRDCRLETTIFAWRFGGQVLPTELYTAADDKIFKPTDAAYSVADPPYNVRVYAILSRPLYGMPEASLEGVAYYECHTPWLLHYAFSVAIVPPSGEDVVPRPSPIQPAP